MKLLYSSHGEASEIYKLCEIKLPDVEELTTIAKTLHSASTAPQGLPASILDRREIKTLVQRSDPRYFLFLRELSIHIKRAYEPLVNSLLSIGYSPVERILVRLCDSSSPTEILAVGLLAGLCGVKDVTLSLDRATIAPETASACRLCGIEHIILCDEISAVGIAAYGTREVLPFSRMICVGSELLGAASGMVSGVCERAFYPERKTAIFAQFGSTPSEALLTDIACLEKHTLPVIATSCEQFALMADDRYKDKNGIVILTSSDEETRIILERCKNLPKRLYGSVPEGVNGVIASKASPLMLSATAPDAIYPYKPTDFLVTPKSEPKSDITAFASSIATFVGKSVMQDAEIDAIGARL